MIRKRHIYRAGNRFGEQRGPYSVYVGYFEIGSYDGRPDVSWHWGSFARQDTRAQRWISGEMARLKEAVTR